MTRARLAAALGALAMFAATSTIAQSQDTLKVAIPQRGAWDAGVAELGERGGIFKKHGLKLEILYTSAGPESIQALIGGSMDIATASGVSAAVGTFAKGAPIRIIGSEMTGAPDLYWFVPAASPIKKIEDLNGKTVAYSLTGSSSHAGLLALIAQYHLTAKPVSTGNIAATMTQTMTEQVDVGLGRRAVRSRQGRKRQDPDHRDRQRCRLAEHPHRARQSHQRRRPEEAARRSGAFRQGYKETVDWMYSDPAALKVYGEYSGLPEVSSGRCASSFPQEAMAIDNVAGMDQIMADAVAAKFIPAPLSADQIKELVQIPK